MSTQILILLHKIFEDSILKNIVKYKNQPRISTSTEDIENKIFDLETKKASQIYDIPTNIIQENIDAFTG